MFLIFSGISTAISWLFYFKAIQIGDVSRVAPIDKLSIVFTLTLAYLLLKEPLTPKVIIGGLLITAGVIIICGNNKLSLFPHLTFYNSTINPKPKPRPLAKRFLKKNKT